MMIEIEKEQSRLPLVLLVGKNENKASADEQVISELGNLAETAGLQVAGYIVLHRVEPAPKFGMGSGKAKEIATCADELDAEQIVFDFEITPTQQRNWEKLTKLDCIDRQELIIRIFASRAMTREAVLQVELARLEYVLPRLVHANEYLSRQRGGRYGTKGAGETKLELDRRSVLNRISVLKKELTHVRGDRAIRRKRRERIPVPSCAIVGYTNAGKSTLLNALTSARVLSEDKLFATLDPTTRRFTLPSGRTVLLTDTVGFIRNLPHSLVDAFHATLEEAVFADVLLLIADASDPEVESQLATTHDVLADIGAEDQTTLLVFNKIDRIDEFTRRRLFLSHPSDIYISAHTGEGISVLAEQLEALLSGTERVYHLPQDRQDLVAFAHREGSVINIEYTDTKIVLRARTSGRLASALQEFSSNEI